MSVDSSETHIHATVKGQRREFEVVHRLEFTADRKRMSVLIKDLHENKVFLLTKGADSAILARAPAPEHDLLASQSLEDTKVFLQKKAEMGLRTLLIAKKEIDEPTLQRIEDDIHEAEQDVNRRMERLNEIYDQIEQYLEIVGATAIEDRLADNVGSTIESFRRAGMKVWMLTGDKMETAENIAFACRLLSHDSQKTYLRSIDDSKRLLQDLEQEGSKAGANESLIVEQDAMSKIT